jgi:hypothetical protein
MAVLSHEEYELLERAVSQGRRIAVWRRGSEFLVIPVSLDQKNGREVISARHPTTGEALSLVIDEIDGFEVIT